MRNYQYEDFDIKPLVTSLLWIIFLAQAKAQILFNKIHTEYLLPTFNYVEKFLNLNSNDENNSEDNQSAKNYCDFKFISCKLEYQKTKSLTIELSDSDYIIGNKLFTKPWIENYIEKECEDNILLDTDNYKINFIDHNINPINISCEEYVILDKNNYIIKTI